MPTNTNSVARLGGDEFTILLTDVSEPSVIEAVAQRILEAMRKPFSFSGHELFVTASIGVALYPTDGNDVDTLMRKADIAMYAVKDNGRNGVLRFSTRDECRDRATLASGDLVAPRAGAQELVLHYQPKIDADSGKIVGAEALMRWQRDGELVPPAEFIAVAEESGLIVPITEWAIARCASAWCAGPKQAMRRFRSR